MERLSVSTMLHDLADSPAPPSSVDILRATALGRRRLRVRRWLLGGSAATGVVAVVAIVSLLVGATPAVGPGPGPAPVGSGGTGELASPVPPMPGAAPEQFDPLVQYAALGWQPDGAVGSSINGGRDWLIVGAEYQGLPTNGDEPAPAGIYLTLVTAGHGIDLFQGDVLVDPAAMLPGAPAEPVNGRRAEWLEGFPLAILRWEYAPGAWAAVEVAENLPGVDTREVARRVAENVQYGVNTRVNAPLRHDRCAGAVAGRRGADEPEQGRMERVGVLRYRPGERRPLAALHPRGPH